MRWRGRLTHVRLVLWVGVVASVAVLAAVRWQRAETVYEQVVPSAGTPMRAAARERLFAALQPVALSNCRLERFGEPHDGGYLMCANLLDGVEAGYSYGIAGYDQWGCDISRRFNVPVHQYDCFDLTLTSCPDGEVVFHPECVAGSTFTDQEGRPFDSVQNQIARNGHAGRHVVLKMDVEGAEWDALASTPDEAFERIDQIALEFHGLHGDPQKYMRTVEKLKHFYHVAHLHFNNYACMQGAEPFPAWAYEVLFVSKRLGREDPNASPVARPHALDAPTNPKLPDCQS